MCGEHEKILLYGDAIPGSSPHVRGAHNLTVDSVQNIGIIPACAGSTAFTRQSCRIERDHPRMCGEHGAQCSAIEIELGSSPHVRGAPCVFHYRSCLVGIIPACAGSTPMRSAGRPCRRDHPRMCGEHCDFDWFSGVFEGSSPHVRGAPRQPYFCAM